jgi:hypothetical protein
MKVFESGLSVEDCVSNLNAFKAQHPLSVGLSVQEVEHNFIRFEIRRWHFLNLVAQAIGTITRTHKGTVVQLVVRPGPKLQAFLALYALMTFAIAIYLVINSRDEDLLGVAFCVFGVFVLWLTASFWTTKVRREVESILT